MTIQANFPAIKPSLLLDFANTKQLDPRITYTRASTASFYNGVTTAKAEENLFPNSEDITGAAWVGLSGTRTANTTTAPDGNTTADTLTASAGSSIYGFYRANTYVAADYTLSIYAKAGTYGFLTLDFNNNANLGATFNLSTGAIGFTDATVTSSITSVGSGWYRCVITKTMTAFSGFPEFYLSSSGTTNGRTFNAAGTETVFLWGAQLEQRSAVTAYTATTTQAITNYIPVLQTAASGVARFDNNPTTGESLGLLIEESRTNLFTYSSDFSNNWPTSALSVTASSNIAPNGTLTAISITPDTSSSAHYINQTGTAVTVTHTISCYAKYNGYRYFQIMGASTTEQYANFDLQGGTITATGTAVSSSVMTSVGNGWYRCSITLSTGAGTIARFLIVPSGTSGWNASGLTGNGFSGVFIWGAQLEAGSFATSYIPTVASQVTRAADAASMTGTNFSSWFNTAEGTFYGNAVPISLTGTSKILSTFPVAAGSFLTMSSNGGSSVTGWYAAGLGSLGTTLAENKLIAKYNTAKYFGGVMNGGTVVESTSSDFAGLATSLAIGQGSASYMNGTIKKIAYYPIRLTNAQIQALTS
jgi:hypothetical protein